MFAWVSCYSDLKTELKLGGLTSAGGALKLPTIVVLMLRVPAKVSFISSTECSLPVSDIQSRIPW